MNAFDISRGARVAPKDAHTANVLARNTFYKPGVGKVINPNKFVPSIGTVVGHAGRAGDYVLVRWDGSKCSADDTVHWANLTVVEEPAPHPDDVIYSEV